MHASCESTAAPPLPLCCKLLACIVSPQATHGWQATSVPTPNGGPPVTFRHPRCCILNMHINIEVLWCLKLGHNTFLLYHLSYFLYVVLRVRSEWIIIHEYILPSVILLNTCHPHLSSDIFCKIAPWFFREIWDVVWWDEISLVWIRIVFFLLC